jgi:uncharacterized protein YjdB
MVMSSAVRSIHRATIAMVALVIWSCGGGGTPTGDNSSLVAAVVVNPSSSTLALNSTLPLQAEVQDAAGAPVGGTPVLWSVRDANIATVSETGVVTGKSLGTTQVAASAGGKSGIATITIQKTPVASIAVRPNRVDAVVGSRTSLVGTASDDAGHVLADRAIVWTSSNTSVATVDATGTVVAVSAGTVTITGASEGKTATATFSITQGAVASVSIAPDKVTMVAGQSTLLAASPRDANGAVVSGKSAIWSSSNTAVATVASDGTVTAGGAGSATITATVDGVSGTSEVTVSNVPVKSVSVSPGTASVAIGASTALSVTVRDANDAVVTGRVVSWTSSNNAVATVSSAGVVTGVSAGSATITATSEGQSGTATVSVTAGGVSVSPASLALAPLQSKPLAVTVTDANGKPINNPQVAWSSSNNLVATVSSSGVVTGLVIGTATITATSGGKSGTAQVTVSLVPVGSVSVSPGTRALTVGQTGAFSATVTDANGTVVTDRQVDWTSSNTSVATVNSSGVVTALAPGSATITATSESKSGTATVTVGETPATSIAIAPTNGSVAQNKSITLTATVKDASGNVLTGRTVTWSVTSNASSVSVSASTGQSITVTGILVGTATISASTPGATSAVSTSTNVNVTAGTVSTVTVALGVGTLKKGNTTTATATVLDSDGKPLAGKSVTWTTGPGVSLSPTSGTTSAVRTTTTTVTGTGATNGSTIKATSDGKVGQATIIVTN